MLGYKLFSEYKTPEDANMKSDHFVGYCYVLYSKAVKENPDLENQAQELLQKWESGDNETIELWKLMNKWAFDGMNDT
jgi:arginyl-tRNA synthetase